MKRGKKMLLLLGVLVLVVAAWLVLVRVGGEDETAGTTKETVLSQVASGDVVTLGWSNGGETTVFEKIDSFWRHAADDAFPVNEFQLEMLAATISYVASSRTIENVTDYAQYGLDKPSLTLTVGYADGTESRYDFGAKNALADGYYGRMNGGSDVYLLSSLIYDSFSVLPEDISKVLATEKIPAMKTRFGLRVKNPGGGMDLVYLADSVGLTYSELYNWFEKQDGGYRAVKVGVLNGLINDLEALQWAGVISYNATETELAACGLLDPVAVLTVQYEQDGAAQEFTLELGNYSETGACYARIADSPMIYLVDTAMADRIILMSYDGMVPDEICYIDMDTLLAFGILLDGETHRIEISAEMRKDDAGVEKAATVYTCDGRELDGVETERLLSSIKAMNANTTVSASAAGAAVRDEVIGFTFYRDAGEYSEMLLRFLRYSSENCLVEFNGERNKLVLSSNVDRLVESARALLAP